MVFIPNITTNHAITYNNFLVSKTPFITVRGTEGLSWINIRLLLLLLLRLEMGLMTEIMFVRMTSPERLVL